MEIPKDIQAVEITRMCNVHAETVTPGKVFTVGPNKDLTAQEAVELVAINKAKVVDQKAATKKDKS